MLTREAEYHMHAEREGFALLVHFPNALRGRGTARLTPGARNSIWIAHTETQGPKSLSHHDLLPSRVYMSRKLDWKLEWSGGKAGGPNPKHWGLPSLFFCPCLICLWNLRQRPILEPLSQGMDSPFSGPPGRSRDQKRKELFFHVSVM